MATAMRVVPLSEDIGAKVKFAVRDFSLLTLQLSSLPFDRLHCSSPIVSLAG